MRDMTCLSFCGVICALTRSEVTVYALPSEFLPDARQPDPQTINWYQRFQIRTKFCLIAAYSLLSVFFLETIDAAFRIEDTLFAGEERMRRR